jgi:ribonuclease HII
MADLRWERRCWNDGYQAVAGVDEAGRGALAGPIVAAAVVFPPGTSRRGALRDINDSKLLTPSQRTSAAGTIRRLAICWSVAAVDARTIDEIGIARANRMAMELAVEDLGTFIEFVLLDALTCELPIPQLGLIDGDALSLSIAAASILAKTERDRMMHELHAIHGCYGFDRHVGYGTPLHLEALRLHGPCDAHRRTFRGVLADMPT